MADHGACGEAAAPDGRREAGDGQDLRPNVHDRPEDRQVHTVSWKKEAAKVHADRWEYLHSEFHAAGYGLDPEFMEMAGDMDEATQNGLMNITEKICLRDVLAEAEDLTEARRTITMDSELVQKRVEKTMEQLG
eukprot:2335863-Prymnesium_polylepis.2